MYQPVPKGTHDWGAGWKRALVETCNHAFGITMHGASMAGHANPLDLDPAGRDMFANPLLRMTFDLPGNDRKMAVWVAARERARAMNPRSITTGSPPEHCSIVSYRTTHNNGGTIMGSSPKNSGSSATGMSGDNVFVSGA